MAMPPAVADRPSSRTWLWLAMLLSAVLHAAVAAVIWRKELPYSTEPDARLVVFELVRTGAGLAPTGEPARHGSLPPSTALTSVPTTNPAADDDAVHVPAPAPALTPTRSPADPWGSVSRATEPASKTSQQQARQASTRRSSRTSESKNQRSRQPQVKGSTATAVGTTRNAGRPGSQKRTQTAQPGESAAGRHAAERDYLNALQRAIARHQRYPVSARRHGQTGVATLSFVIGADGRLGQIRLAQSSGHAALDQAALQALARLGHFDPIPRSLGRSTWSLRIPIRFDLQ